MSFVTSVYMGTGYSRVHQILVNGKNLVLPTYFPAISSAETRYMLEPLLQTILTTNYPRILISAYDLHHLIPSRHKHVSKIISDYSKKNFIFLDSGTFESYWLSDHRWTFSKYKIQIKNVNSDFYTSFDSVPTIDKNYDEIEKETVSNIKKSKNLGKSNVCIGVCHGQTPSQLIKLIKKIINSNFQPQMLAIPERDCGKTIADKIKTVQAIRQLADQASSKILLHVLGLGNPLTMALLTFSGANSFDSVDWSRWIVDRRTLQFTDLANLFLTGCSCKACKATKIDFTLRAMFHNLLFYQEFVQGLQKTIIDKEEKRYLKQILAKDGFSRLKRFFPN